MSSPCIDFMSRNCKTSHHDTCEKSWSGFGFQMLCCCSCHEEDQGRDD